MNDYFEANNLPNTAHYGFHTVQADSDQANTPIPNLGSNALNRITNWAVSHHIYLSYVLNYIYQSHFIKISIK